LLATGRPGIAGRNEFRTLLETVVPASPKVEPARLRHLAILDGWRTISIGLVVAGHWLPIGPSGWLLNGAVAATGMVLFFTLSGFLITRFLIEDGDVQRFAIRRVLRIVPLAWVGMTMAFVIVGGTASDYVGSLLFYANLPPFFLLGGGGHFWSLCLEMQFYVGIALLVAIGGQRALLLLPAMAIGVTINRIAVGQTMNIVTWFRIDEILAGCTIALVYHGWLGGRAQAWLARCNIFVLLPLVFASAHDWSGPLNYARPYLSAIMIGASIYNAPQWLRQVSEWKVTTYFAKTSYAIYVFHGVFSATALGTGATDLVKYAKRPALFAVTMLCAHVSTFHFEKYWNDLARRLTPRARASPEPGRAKTAAA
jgi:peptidoglycan/LPS O-acetylase OafA/YrhL